MPLRIVRDDLSNMRCDAVVLPSNERLRVDGGAGAAVAKKAGLLRVRHACRKLKGCAVGNAVATPAFSFPAKHLIHAVGPVWSGAEGDAHLLRSAYESAVRLAAELGCETVAMPLLSAGSFGCPAHVSLSIALSAIEGMLGEVELDVTLVLLDKRAVAAGLDFLGELESRIDDAYAEEHAAQGTALLSDFPGEPMMQAPMRSPARFGVGFTAAFKEPKALGERVRGRAADRKRASEEAAALDAEAPDGDDACAATPSAPMRAADAAAVPHERADGTDAADAADAVAVPCERMSAGDATALLEQRIGSMEAGFSQALLSLIDESGMTDAQVYRRANMSRQHFSKIRSNAGYRPSKATVLALCVALELNLVQTRDLLSRAGFAFSHANKFDIIVEFFIEREIYDQFKINETLFYFDQPLLGG